jgi:hypothetical protein
MIGKKFKKSKELVLCINIFVNPVNNKIIKNNFM